MYKESTFLSFTKLLVLLGFLFTFYSCDVYVGQERNKNAIPLIELSAKKLMTIVIDETASSSPKDKAYDYDSQKIEFLPNNVLKVPIKFRWTASKGLIFKSRKYCETVGILTIYGDKCTFKPETGNTNLKEMAPTRWMDKTYQYELEYSNRNY